MRRAIGIALGLGAVLFSVGRVEGQTPDVPATRTVGYPSVGPRDEDFIGEFQGALFFVSPDKPGTGGNPTGWVHVEWPTDKGPAGRPMRSAIVFFEFDCPGKKMREVYSIVAAAANLQKPYPPMPHPARAWLSVGSDGIFKAYPKVCVGSSTGN